MTLQITSSQQIDQALHQLPGKKPVVRAADLDGFVDVPTATRQRQTRSPVLPAPTTRSTVAKVSLLALVLAQRSSGHSEPMCSGFNERTGLSWPNNLTLGDTLNTLDRHCDFNDYNGYYFTCGGEGGAIYGAPDDGIWDAIGQLASSCQSLGNQLIWGSASPRSFLNQTVHHTTQCVFDRTFDTALFFNSSSRLEAALGNMTTPCSAIGNNISWPWTSPSDWPAQVSLSTVKAWTAGCGPGPACGNSAYSTQYLTCDGAEAVLLAPDQSVMNNALGFLGAGCKTLNKSNQPLFDDQLQLSPLSQGAFRQLTKSALFFAPFSGLSNITAQINTAATQPYYKTLRDGFWGTGVASTFTAMATYSLTLRGDPGKRTEATFWASAAVAAVGSFITGMLAIRVKPYGF